MKRTTRKPPSSTGITNGSKMRENSTIARAKSPAKTQLDHRFESAADTPHHPCAPRPPRADSNVGMPPYLREVPTPTQRRPTNDFWTFLA